MTRALLLISLVVISAIRSHAKPRFDPRAETFAFSNDTVFSYGIDERGALTMQRKEKAPNFSHRCFVLVRAVLQFHKFAHFSPRQPRASESEYRQLVRRVSRVPVWFHEKRDRLVIPGYANLHDFSRGRENLLKEELGEWFPTYLRVGNWRMIGPFPRAGQALAARTLTRQLDSGELQAVYITRFPQMNHCLILFDYHRSSTGDIRFDIYDPNYPNQVGSLLYRAKERSFDFPKRWFWTGGRVNLMRIYISPVH